VAQAIRTLEELVRKARGYIIAKCPCGHSGQLSPHELAFSADES
jgi:hypothetical protein